MPHKSIKLSHYGQFFFGLAGYKILFRGKELDKWEAYERFKKYTAQDVKEGRSPLEVIREIRESDWLGRYTKKHHK